MSRKQDARARVRATLDAPRNRSSRASAHALRQPSRRAFACLRKKNGNPNKGAASTAEKGKKVFKKTHGPHAQGSARLRNVGVLALEFGKNGLANGSFFFGGGGRFANPQLGSDKSGLSTTHRKFAALSSVARFLSSALPALEAKSSLLSCTAVSFCTATKHKRT